MFRRIRILQQIYAFWTGYFWLPCPICKENFGGHEVSDVALMTGDYEGVLVCYKSSCQEEAIKRNLESPFFPRPAA